MNPALIVPTSHITLRVSTRPTYPRFDPLPIRRSRPVGSLHPTLFSIIVLWRMRPDEGIVVADDDGSTTRRIVCAVDRPADGCRRKARCCVTRVPAGERICTPCPIRQPDMRGGHTRANGVRRIHWCDYVGFLRIPWSGSSRRSSSSSNSALGSDPAPGPSPNIVRPSAPSFLGFGPVCSFRSNPALWHIHSPQIRRNVTATKPVIA